MAASELVPGIVIVGAWTLIGAALLLGIVNAVVRPLLVILTLPITVITLGLFLLVVNAAMLGLWHGCSMASPSRDSGRRCSVPSS